MAAIRALIGRRVASTGWADRPHSARGGTCTVGTISVAVSLHLAGMYVASPLAGVLCDRFGRLAIIALGAALLIIAVVTAGLAPGTDRFLVIGALFLICLPMLFLLRSSPTGEAGHAEPVEVLLATVEPILVGHRPTALRCGDDGV